MKRLLIILFMIPATIMAQENQNEFKSIFNKKSDQKVDHGGFVSFGLAYSQIDGRDAINMSISGAWLINHSVALGFSGTGFFNNLDKSNNTVYTNSYNMTFWKLFIPQGVRGQCNGTIVFAAVDSDDY